MQRRFLLPFASSIEIEYANKTIGFRGERTSATAHRCILDDEEYITEVELYQGDWYSHTAVFDVMFTTETQSCGPYGRGSDASKLFTGHHLLWISGGSGMIIDGLTLHFDYDCAEL